MKCSFLANKSPSHQFLEQAARIDASPIAYLPRLLESYRTKYTPEQISAKYNTNEKNHAAEYTSLGKEKLKQGRVALLIMAGGAATRLGADCPKGAFRLANTCLFEILLKNAKEAGEPHVIILLSCATACTQQIFEYNAYYGYAKEKISFVFYAEYPVVSEHGEILCLENYIYQSPNGNGGFLNALKDFNLEQFDYLHVIGVDNAFVKPVDAEEIGFAYAHDFDVVNRVLVPKYGEKVGVCGFRKNNAAWQCPIADISHFLPEICPTVFEYSEIDWSKLDADKTFGSIANHLFKCTYLSKILQIQREKNAVVVPYHLANKKVAYFDFEQHKLVSPEAPNAWKFEHFIFDYFHFCSVEKYGLFICGRDEFIPLKEKTDIDGILAGLGLK